MKRHGRSPDCNPIEHIWDELGHAITSMDNQSPNLGEFHQALLDKWAEIPVECLQRLAASMPRGLVAIIAARGGNTKYWPGTHKTTPTASIMQKVKFVWPDLPQLLPNDISVCSCSQFFQYQRRWSQIPFWSGLDYQNFFCENLLYKFGDASSNSLHTSARTSPIS